MTSSKPKVLVTGASGLIGSITIKALGDKYEFSALNRRKVDGIPCLQADISDFDAIQPAFEDIDIVLHLSAYTTNIHEWEGTRRVNIDGTYNVFETARAHGVKRVVFASTGSTVLGYAHDSPYKELSSGQYDKIQSVWPLVDYTMPVRPDSLYGASKVFGEALARHYSDYYDMSMICIRLGAVLDTDKPKLIQHYPGYLSQADCVQMVDKCLSAPESLKFDVFDAVSNNRCRWRDTSHATKVLGWHPQGSSDTLTMD